MRDIDELLAALKRSKFRSRFHLSASDREYYLSKGPEAIREHAVRFVTDRLAPANPVNDGKQTPMRNHPVFVAQHATATCCRKCVEKWHKIPIGSQLQANHINGLVEVIMCWLKNEMGIAKD